MRRLTGGTAPRRAALVAGVALVALAGACAQPAPPPGGPPDPLPPVLVRVVPESGAVNARPPEVLFRFDEVIAERPSGATNLGQLVVISPRDGTPDVAWRRTGVGVRPARGWRPNTTYRIELRRGIADLRNNVRDSGAVVVFSTGPAITETWLRGTVFDWPRGEPARGALVQGMVRVAGARADSVTFVTFADSSGRFELPHVPPGTVLVRAGLDANRSFGLEGREPWDSLSVTLADSARVELYAFVHDTVGPRIASVTPQDSMTIVVTLDQPLAVDQPLDAGLVRLERADSTPLAIASVLSRRAADSAATARADSLPADSLPTDPLPTDPLPTDPLPVAPADSLPAVPVAADSVAADSVAADSAAADSVAAAAPPPVPSRPIPVTELVVRTTAPLEPGARYLLRVVGARGLLGAVQPINERTFTVPRPEPRPEPEPAEVRPDSAAPPPRERR